MRRRRERGKGSKGDEAEVTIMKKGLEGADQGPEKEKKRRINHLCRHPTVLMYNNLTSPPPQPHTQFTDRLTPSQEACHDDNKMLQDTPPIRQ